MPTSTLTLTSIISATGWADATAATLNTSDDTRATGGEAGEFISAELSDTPGDFSSQNSIQLSAEARISGAGSRTKQMVFELRDSAENILETHTTGDLTTSDVVYNTPVWSRVDSKAVIDGYRFRITITEGGGMPDAVVVDIDHMFATLDYNEIFDQTITAPLVDDSTDTFYSPTVGHEQDLTVPFLDDSADTFYGITLTEPAFPLVRGTATHGKNTGIDVVLPATVEPDDLLPVFIMADTTATVNTPSGWTLEHSDLQLWVFSKVADGSEGGATVTFSGSSGSYVALAISGSASVLESIHAANTSADPPSLTASWGSDDNLWLTACFGASTGTTPEVPAGYTTLVAVVDGSDGRACGSLEKAAATEDPGPFTEFDFTPTMATLAIQPAAVTAQSLTAPLTDDSVDTFYAATVDPGPVTITAPLFDDSVDTFYAFTISQALSLVAPLLDDSTDTFYSPTITVGDVSLTAPFLDDSADTFYTMGVTEEGGLSMSLFDDSADTFYPATITVGDVALTVPLLDDSTDTFYSPTIELGGAPQTLTIPLLDDSADTFHAATLAPGDVTLSPPYYIDPDTFYPIELIIIGALTLELPYFTSPNTFYPLTLTGGIGTIHFPKRNASGSLKVRSVSGYTSEKGRGTLSQRTTKGYV